MKFTHLLALFVLLKDSIQLFGRDEDGYGNYDYQLTSYDSNGKTHPAKFTGTTSLNIGELFEKRRYFLL
ncbi:DUF1093 domain-containing protein [Loigolactobacillus coryniformis]|uniref:Uncharacterized protein n=1 Tax=Loigolactobacillus coryniformis subsp. torquens DSM 20004 = KCTC 3535 TaxID=1423822 RepID=A0A2D1KSN0_9LACO|nr:DUF1093 domain-containing protein [Loigolactobacillus coryniformis]ATO45156.1 hypothetical protein LC20004_14595 [Loigolactobacillus coryniformis subsp. torquens DSM 20004 = KCTC 3535]